MNVFDLLWLLLFSFGGAFMGSEIAGELGAGAGLVGGLSLLFALGWIQSRPYRHMPSCPCGAEWKTLTLERHPTWRFVHRCRRCERTLMMRRGSVIDLVKDGTRTPYMRRTFFGGWKPKAPTGGSSGDQRV